MGTLGYTATISIDGYAADADGDFQWSAPGDDVFDFHVERMADVSAEILGRRTYELMRYWEAEPAGEAWSAAEHEFARRWQSLDIVVASSTLTREKVADADVLVPHLGLADVERIVGEAAGEVEIFGPTVASEAIRAGLVDHFRLFIMPKAVGGGLRALPGDARLGMDVVGQRVFQDGTVYLHYTRAR